LLSFKVHQFLLNGRHYLLLPKLTHGQMRVLAVRLQRNGYSVQLSKSLSAKSRGGVIRVDPSGLCWSMFDCSDEVLPAIPEVLSSPKETGPLDVLESMYFRLARSGRKTLVRLATRLESSTSWDALRATGDCALAPDEHAVATFLTRRARGTCIMLTDFPGDEAVPKLFGRKRYFESTVGFDDAESTLRSVGERASRNSYLLRDNTLRLSGRLAFSRDDVEELFEGLGEWCYFAPD
jgi:hypothetical protein